MTLQEIERYLQALDADFENVYEENVGGILFVTITVVWGDWKHSHILLD